MHRFIQTVQNEQGVETLEWIVVGALIVAVAMLVYTGTLGPQLVAAVNAIGAKIVGLAGGGKT